MSASTSDTPTPVIRPLPGTAPRSSPDQHVLGAGWRITVLEDGLFRIETGPAAESDFGEDRASSFAIRRDLPTVPFTVTRDGHGVVVATARARIRYDGGGLSASGLLVETLGVDARRWRYGEPTRDLGGTARTLDDVDGRVALEPGVIAPDGITVVDDSDSFLFDDDGWVTSRPEGTRDLYVFAFGRDHEAAVRAFYAVSGSPVLLPRWALGNWWSRYHPYSSESYLALMERFEAEKLPFSVAVIDMDWHRVDSVPAEFGSGWTGYSWERSLIPDPAALLGDLHDRGMRTTLNLHPADGVRAFEDRYPEMARAVGVDPETGQAIPFSPTDRTFLQAYFTELHHPLEAQGVDFWWIDWQQGAVTDIPGVDPLWLLNHFHHLDALRDGGTGMTFSRYAGPGSHRYAVGFSGDAVVSWASLAFQPEFTAAAANIGYAWWSHDIGGHTRGIHDDELATRWVQFGVLSPIMRLHSANNPFIRKEPWKFAPEHRNAMSDALRLRHRLVPYLHTMNHRTADDGVPLVRPMYHSEPRRSEAYEVPNQYTFGSELIVAPVTETRDARSRRAGVRVWLPAGLWTDIVTGTVYVGDRSLMLHRAIASVPVLLKQGGILPLDATDALDATRNPEALEVLVAPGADGSLELVEDGDESSASSASARTRLSWNREAGTFRIGAVEGDGSTVPGTRRWTITFLAKRPDGAVTVGGVPADVTGDDGRWSVAVESGSDASTVITVEGSPLEIGRSADRELKAVLEDAQMGNAEKLAAWQIVTSDAPALVRAAELDAAGLPDSVRAALVELLASVVA